MSTFVLTDVTRDVWLETLAIDALALGLPATWGCVITKRRLHGGRREGVDLIEVQNGPLSFSIIPTRGMGLWKGLYHGCRLGWDSPVADGPVHPAFVNLAASGGLGWLDGFDELLARCGLANNGAPFEIKTRHADGTESNTTFGLHGKIQSIPASYVAVHVSDQPPYEIVVEGHVEESHLFGPQIKMVSRISTTPGSNRLTVRDEFLNRKDQPVEMQVLYHWNFGPPFLEEGSRFVAPLKTVTPRDPRAVEGLARHDVYAAPEPGSTEQVYFYELHAREADADAAATLAMLCSRDADKAVVLRYHQKQLPCFTLWKNTSGPRDGYVTGLEPATNFPNPRPFEKARGRVVTLPVDGRFEVEMTLEVLNSAEAVAAISSEVNRVQSQVAPVVNPGPTEPFAAGL